MSTWYYTKAPSGPESKVAIATRSGWCFCTKVPSAQTAELAQIKTTRSLHAKTETNSERAREHRPGEEGQRRARRGGRARRGKDRGTRGGRKHRG